MPQLAKQPPSERDYQIKDAYKPGVTLQEVGDQFGISRERVRQVLEYRFGISSRPKFSRKAVGPERRKRQEEDYLRVYGMSYQAHRQHVYEYGRKPYRAYTVQRCAAAQRGIEWKFNFAGWFAFWLSSGKWSERGLDGYVMSRIGDKGPYSLENCRIVTNGDNIREHHQIRACAL